MAKTPTVNPEALTSFISKADFLEQVDRRRPCQINRVSQASDRQNRYALRPMHALADVIWLLRFYGVSSPAESVVLRQKLRRRKALELDDSLAEAHASLVYCHRELDVNRVMKSKSARFS